MAENMIKPTDPDVVEMINKFNTLPLEEARALAEEQLECLENVTLNIAVTGASGSGKSSFINAMRGLNDEDEGAAETGVVETTKEPTKYTHPNMPNVNFWDLPGIGTTNFKAKEYLKKVKFQTYDFFIIVGATRFQENDLRLAKEIKKMKKLFYFVRSKIDVDVAAEEGKRGFDEEKMLQKVREDCEEHLLESGNPKVFLVSSKKLEKYDFQKLVDTLQEDLDEFKAKALIMSLPVSSVATIQKKKKIIMKMIWVSCLTSAGAAIVPVPGLSVAVDVAIIVTFFTSCYRAFGLDDKSVKRLSERVNVPVEELKAAMKSPFEGGISTEVVMRFAASAGVATAMTLEFLFSMVPAVGSVLAGGLSFATTYYLSKKGLDEMAAAAERMLEATGLP